MEEMMVSSADETGSTQYRRAMCNNKWMLTKPGLHSIVAKWKGNAIKMSDKNQKARIQ